MNTLYKISGNYTCQAGEKLAFDGFASLNIDGHLGYRPG